MRISLFSSLALIMACAPSVVYAGAVNVNIYSGYQDAGGGAPFSGLVGSFSSPDIQFGTDTDFQWSPFGLTYFGADLTGILSAASSSIYRLAMTSDDGSELFIDGAMVLDDGGTHGPGLAFTDLPLTKGKHTFEIQYFQGACCQAGLDLTLPMGVTFAKTPEPASFWLLIIGLGSFCSFVAQKKGRR